jgi:hypothetical protein
MGHPRQILADSAAAADIAPTREHNLNGARPQARSFNDVETVT